jgi:outer membrane lipoprotein-sorting protein
MSTMNYKESHHQTLSKQARLLMLSIALFALSMPAGAAPLTGPQVLENSKAAYAKLNTYECYTKASSSFAFTGALKHQGTTAHIRYERTGKIRVDGTSFTGRPFAFVCSGNITEFNAFGAWTHLESPEMAIASATGISNHAATLVPALLLNNRVIAMMFNPQCAEAIVTSGSMDGHSCYKVVANSQYKTTFWIDKNTWLLVKSVEDLSAITKAMGGGPGRSTITVEFNTIAVNRPIPARVFVLPQ